MSLEQVSYTNQRGASSGTSRHPAASRSMDQGYRFLGTYSSPRVIPRVEFSVIVARVLAFFACLVTFTITQHLYLLFPWFSKGGTGSVWINPDRQHYQFLRAITKVTALFL